MDSDEEEDEEGLTVLVAVFLCTAQGNLQVFYQDLPLSIQDGYERFLTSSSVSLQQYQVQVQTICDRWLEVSKNKQS